MHSSTTKSDGLGTLPPCTAVLPKWPPTELCALLTVVLCQLNLLLLCERLHETAQPSFGLEKVKILYVHSHCQIGQKKGIFHSPRSETLLLSKTISLRANFSTWTHLRSGYESGVEITLDGKMSHV